MSHYPDTGLISPRFTPCLSAKRGAASTIFNVFGLSRPGIEPVTFPFPGADTLHTELSGPVKCILVKRCNRSHNMMSSIRKYKMHVLKDLKRTTVRKVIL